MMAPPFPSGAVVAARDAAKAYLRIGDAGEDAVLTRVAATALGLAEQVIGEALVLRDWTVRVAADGGWQALPIGAVRAILEVAAVEAGGDAVPLPAEAYAIDIDARGKGWVRVRGSGGAAVAQVRFAAGMAADWDELPPPIAQGVVLLIAHLFQAEGSQAAPPAAVTALWRPFRRLSLAVGR